MLSILTNEIDNIFLLSMLLYTLFNISPFYILFIFN